MAGFYAKLAIVTMATMALLVTTNGFAAKKIGNELIKAFNVDKEFDYFTLALSWPASYCKNTTKCCKYNACCKGSEAPNEFVIHGLWPDYADGSWPTCCNNNYPYNADEVKDLADELTKYWPTFKCKLSKTCNGTKVAYLAYSWETYGTCAYPILRDQYSYFTAGLELFFIHNVTEVLSEAGYVASNSASHSLAGIVSTIKKAFGANPFLTCDTSTGAIKDVRLCFTKHFRTRDCGDGTITKTCAEKVTLPSYTSSGINHSGHAISWMDEVEDL